jgi:hypothetical protein
MDDRHLKKKKKTLERDIPKIWGVGGTDLPTPTRVMHRELPRGYGCGTAGWRQQACNIGDKRRGDLSTGAARQRATTFAAKDLRAPELPSSVVASNWKLKFGHPPDASLRNSFLSSILICRGVSCKLDLLRHSFGSAARLLRNHF